MKETYISKEKLKNVLNRLAKKFKSKYEINLWFVEIFGKRLSYFAGNSEIEILPPENIIISKNFGIVSSEWNRLNEEQKDEIINSVKLILDKYE